MTWPQGNIDSGRFDQDSDRISESRPELFKIAVATNQIANTFDPAGAEANNVLAYNTASSRFEAVGNITVGTVTATGTVTAGSFVGDGSGLTGLPAAGNSFSNINVDGTVLSAESAADTLTITAGNNIVITGNAATDTLTISATASAGGAGISNGNTSVDIPTAAGNIIFTANGSEKFRVNNTANNEFTSVGVDFSSGIKGFRGSFEQLLVTEGANSNVFSMTESGANSSPFGVANFIGDVRISRNNILTPATLTVERINCTRELIAGIKLRVPVQNRSGALINPGGLGEIRAISDQDGKLVFWSQAGKWKYVHDNSDL
jgi:hypothetical protein